MAVINEKTSPCHLTSKTGVSIQTHMFGHTPFSKKPVSAGGKRQSGRGEGRQRSTAEEGETVEWRSKGCAWQRRATFQGNSYKPPHLLAAIVRDD